MPRSQPDSYSRTQITLHWLIAALVVFQIIFAEGIDVYGDALRNGQTPDITTYLLGMGHVWAGIAVLVLMIARIGLRFSHGAPAPVAAPKLQDMAAKVVHGLFYLVLIAAPVTGIAAWFFQIRPAGEIHHFTKPVLIVLIGVHVVGALWHQFALKDDLMRRMVSSGKTA